MTEQMHAHLTAAIVSNDVQFLQKVLANTVNGTTYAGIRARCTGQLPAYTGFSTSSVAFWPLTV